MENFKDVRGYEGVYIVGDCGTVKSLDSTISRPNSREYIKKSKTLKPSLERFRLIVGLRKDNRVRTFGVHTLVMEAFVGPRPLGMMVCHTNGDFKDNRLSNLRYGYPQDNTDDAVRHGTVIRKINKNDIQTIIKLREEGLTLKKIAEKFDVNYLTIRKNLIKYSKSR